MILLDGEWLNNSNHSGTEIDIPELSTNQRTPKYYFRPNKIYEIQYGECFRVLHNGHGHWITFSIYGCETGVVDVYDSLSPTVTSSMHQQIAAIICLPHPNKEITLRYVLIIHLN